MYILLFSSCALPFPLFSISTSKYLPTTYRIIKVKAKVKIILWFEILNCLRGGRLKKTLRSSSQAATWV